MDSLQHTIQNYQTFLHLLLVDLGYFTKIHLMQTGLHVLHLILSYMAMLIVMTYNVYMFLAIVLGAMFGYFIFFRRRFVMFNEQDCCH
ncbi:unnamed protein product [Dibothriocephalus latus]|uniref:Copper transport protein n=1 Tax=Dibothriocephalus latus TaxID=60516 RepID=A0A3P7M0C3_DIBLA|nr:unnamed protein product [Dibothriocephalus latus]